MREDIKDIKKDSLWANLALMVLYPYSFLTGLTAMQGVHIIFPAFALSVLVLVIIGLRCNNKKLFKRYISLLVLVIIFLFLNIIFVGNSDIKNVIYGAFLFPSIAALMFFYKVRYWVAIVLFYSVAFFFGSYIYQNGPFISEETELLVNSRNYVSYFVVLYSLPYFIHCFDYDKIPSILVPTICTVIAVFAIGRSGIIVSLGLLVGVLYLKMMQKSRIRVLYRVFFITLIFILLFVGAGFDFIDTYFSRFSEIGMNDAGRMPSWSEYTISMINPINLLTGTRIESLNYTMKYLNGSLHNSFFTLHAREGLIGLVLIVYMFKGFWNLFKSKCYTLVIVFMVLLFKGLTDADMGGTYSGGDIYVYFLVLVYLFYNNKHIKYERKSVSAIPTSVPSNS